MRARRIIAPLVAASTWRRGVFLLPGGVLALAYALLGVIFAQMFAQDVVSRLPVLAGRPVPVKLAVVPATLVALAVAGATLGLCSSPDF